MLWNLNYELEHRLITPEEVPAHLRVPTVNLGYGTEKAGKDMSVTIDLTGDAEGGGGSMASNQFTCVKCSFISTSIFKKIRICKVRQDSDRNYLLYISCDSRRSDFRRK